MLRRNSSKLNRRKSTTSVHSKHESIDPEVARHHAHVAATLAFTRAQERNQADASHSAPKRILQYTQEQSSHLHDGERGVLKRQQSVRFAGPHAVERRKSGKGRTVDSGLVPQQSLATLRPVALTTNSPVPAAYRPPSRSSSLGKGSFSKATAENLAIVNGVYNEYYAREDDVASTPSSYRRIRKSKSMFSPLKAPSIFYTNGTPERLQHEDEHSNPRISEDQQSRKSLRAPKSMSFLRGSRDYRTAPRERNDAAVQLARDRFFSQTAQQRLREQPSFLFRSKAQRQEKVFKKSVRNTSANSYGLPISSEEKRTPKESGLKDVARKASRSLRSRFKRVFGRSKDEPVEVPNQQVDAKETHVRRYLGDIPVDQYANVPHPNEASLSRVSARIPSLHAVGSNQKLRSYAGSVKSARSFATDHSDDHSRVTSWNTSTGVNTMTSQATRLQAAEKEQQRLSVIKEHGTHMPSSSFKRPEISSQFLAHAMQKQGQNSAPTPVDSARVYSALMRRIDENSPKGKHQAPYEIAEIEPLPQQSSSAKTIRTSRSQATIRCVTAEPSEVSSLSDHGHQWSKEDPLCTTRTDTEIPETHVQQWVAAEAMRGTRHVDDVFSDHNKENKPVQRYTHSDSTTMSYHTVPELNGLSPQEMALKNELLLMPPKAMRDSRSTFFGGTTAFTISRTPSPFRRALAESSSHASDQPYIPRRLSPLRNPLFSAGSADHDHLSDEETHDADIAYSESVYSRTTSGRTPDIFATLPIQSLPTPRTSILPNRGGNGDAVIINSTTYRPLIPAVRKDHSVTSSMGSVEWKRWMSSEVAKLERAKDGPNSGGYINYALPTMPKSYASGHSREYSQIANDETEAIRNNAPVKHPLGVIRQNPNIPQAAPARTVFTRRSTSSLVGRSSSKVNFHHSTDTLAPPVLKPILKNRSTSSLVENKNNNPAIVSRPALPPPPPPPLPPMRSSLRPMPSKSSMRSVGTINSVSSIPSPVKISSMNGRHVLHKRHGSTTTLRSTKSVEVPTVTTKLVKRSGRPASSNPSPSNLPVPVVRNDRKFGSNSSRSRSSVRAARIDNSRAREVAGDMYETEGAGLMGPGQGRSGGNEMSEGEVQTIGSKRMVDMFLSSRRRRVASASDDGAQVFL